MKNLLIVSALRSAQKACEDKPREERQACEPQGDKFPRTPLADFFNILLMRMAGFMGVAMVEFFFCGFPDTDDLDIKIKRHAG